MKSGCNKRVVLHVFDSSANCKFVQISTAPVRVLIFNNCTISPASVLLFLDPHLSSGSIQASKQANQLQAKLLKVFITFSDCNNFYIITLSVLSWQSSQLLKVLISLRDCDCPAQRPCAQRTCAPCAEDNSSKLQPLRCNLINQMWGEFVLVLSLGVNKSNIIPLPVLTISLNWTDLRRWKTGWVAMATGQMVKRPQITRPPSSWT